MSESSVSLGFLRLIFAFAMIFLIIQRLSFLSTRVHTHFMWLNL